MILSDLAIFLVREPNSNLPTPNNAHTVDYFYRICASGSQAHENYNTVIYFIVPPLVGKGQ